MRRKLKLLTLLAFVPGGALAQVKVTLLERNELKDLHSAMTALEASREALLQAREAVDTALIEVDQALQTLRAMAPPSPRRSGPLPVLPAGSAWGEALARTSGRIRSALKEKLTAWQPVLEDFRRAACRALVFREEPAPLKNSTPRSEPAAPAEEPVIAAQAAILREEDVQPLTRAAVLGVSTRGEEFLAPEAVPTLPMPSPSGSVLEAAIDRCEPTPATNAVPAASGDVQPTLPRVEADPAGRR